MKATACRWPGVWPPGFRLLLLLLPVLAPAYPAPAGAVSDLAQVLSPADEAAILREVLPEFRAGRMSGGIRRGAAALVRHLATPVIPTAPSSPAGVVASLPAAVPSPGVPPPRLPAATTPSPTAPAPASVSPGLTLAAVAAGVAGLYGLSVLLRRRSLAQSLRQSRLEGEELLQHSEQIARLLDTAAVSAPEIATAGLRMLWQRQQSNQTSTRQKLQEMEARCRSTWSLPTVLQLEKEFAALRLAAVVEAQALHAAERGVADELRAKSAFFSALGPEGTMARHLAGAQAFAHAHASLSDALGGELQSLAEEVRQVEELSEVKAGGSWAACARQTNRVLTALGDWLRRAETEVRLQQEAREKLPGLLLSLPDKIQELSGRVVGSDKARTLLSSATSQLQLARIRYTGVAQGGLGLNDMVGVYLLLQASDQQAYAAHQTWLAEQEAARSANAASNGWFFSNSNSSSDTSSSPASSGFGGGSFDSSSSGGSSGSW